METKPLSDLSNPFSMIYYYIYLLIMYMHVCAHVHAGRHSSQVEVRGHLLGVDSLLPSCGPYTSNLMVSTLSHPVSSKALKTFFFFKETR